MKRDFTYTTAEGHQTKMTLFGSELPADRPCIVYFHGFKGFKDWGFVPYLAETLSSQGFRVLTYNFSHNGIGANPIEFTELDRFRDNTFSREVAEAREVVQAGATGQLFEVAPGVAVGVIGHSRGGGIALLACADLPPVKAVCTWAAVATFFRYPEAVLADWKEKGVLDIMNSRTGQVMPLGWQLYEDLFQHGEGELNIEKAVRALEIPLAVVHGVADETVALADARQIFHWATSPAKVLHEIAGAGHSFGAKHPFAGPNAMLDEALDYTAQFFSHHLNA
ncbi:MAG: alpha/beta fold hydrolase [Bacteroidota bacterium]